jgi:hypothetical protein
VLHQSAKLTSFLANTDVEHPTPLDAAFAVHDSISYRFTEGLQHEHGRLLMNFSLSERKEFQ